MGRDEILQLLHHAASAHVGAGAMHEHGEGVDRLGVDEDRHFHQITRAIVGDDIIEAGVALGDGLQAIIEIEDHFVQRQVIDGHGALADVAEINLQPAPLLAELQHGAQMLVRRQDRGADPGLGDLLDLHDIGHVGGIVQVHLLAVGELDLVDDAGRSRDEVEVELARQALLDDLQMQQAQESAAEAEAKGRRGLHLVGEAGVVEAQAPHGRAQILEIGGVHREQAAEDHGLGGLEARQGLRAAALLVGDGVAHARVRHLLDLRGDEADLAGAKDGHVEHLGLEDADLLDLVMGVRAHHLDALALLHGAVDDAHQHHDAQISVIPAIDQQGLEGRGLVALGGRQAGDDGLQHQIDAQTRLGRNRHGLGGVDADDVLDLLLDALGFGGGQVDLVEHGHDVMARIDGVVDIGEGLRLDAL